jgi:hypothetical protein
LSELGERYIEYAKLDKRSWQRDVQMLNRLPAFSGTAKLRGANQTKVEEYRRTRAEPWGQHKRTNPVRFVKFLPEDNLRLETPSADRTPLGSPPYRRELILFAINTGLLAQCGY